MKPLLRTSLLLFLLLATASLNLFGQNQTVTGKITDAQNRQPLAFVNVVVNGGLTGAMSDINGRYEVSSNDPIRTILFSSVGYETKQIDLQPGTKKYNIALQPITFELSEIVINAGENPAHRIIDSLMAHRKANNPNSLESYHYHIYDQMVITIDSSDFGKALTEAQPTGESAMQMFDSILKKSDLMVMETASEVFFHSPDRKLQNVLGTKIAGMKEPTFIYLVNSMQSISFYDEVINVAGTNYINPISRGSKSRYFFTLEATHPIGQGDSLYVISFHPYKGSTFNGLRGTMTVNSDGWGLQSVKAEPNEQGELFTANIQQLYQKVDGQWFPKQLNTNLRFPSMAVSIDGNAFPMVAIGKSYLSDIEINPDLSKRRFSDLEIVVDPKASYRDEAFWTEHRIDSLTQRVRATYQLVDSITNGSNIFDRAMGITDKLLEQSALPIGPFDIDIGKLINLSTTRGWYFGFGAATNNRLARWFSISGFVGYWTRLDALDYGGGLKFKLKPQRQMELNFRYDHKSDAIGEFGGFQENINLLSENDYKYNFYENGHVRKTAITAAFSTRFARHFKGFLTLGSSDKDYIKQFYHIPSDSLTHAHFTTAEVKLRFAYKEKFLSKPNGIQSLGTTYPIVWVSYTHAFPDLLGGDYEYDRIKFEVSKNFYFRYMGVSKVILQAGYASESCPVMETFDLIGSHEPFGLYSPGSFGTMRYDEFFSDRFAALYLSHNFSGMIWKTNSKWFKPQLTLVTNIGWGDMKRAEAYTHKNFNTMEKGYYESGFIVKGVLSVMWAKVGVGVLYRYGPYAFDNVWNNFSWKWSATFEL